MTQEQSEKAIELLKETLEERYAHIRNNDRCDEITCKLCSATLDDKNGNCYSDIKCYENCVGKKVEKFLKELEDSKPILTEKIHGVSNRAQMEMLKHLVSKSAK